ncbi:hypothetical protein LOK49_LG03G02544 [Camellia lanceoleosa]|uniref:Uncharacterized protein n=1 Tax=Camellia lanceoleosa TaxID=1840588 RepID=A0ACC0I9H6_9ERIC|nr:hypothetical protein LOK49_LG03G02544 [Camellia lanceoleosa]
MHETIHSPPTFLSLETHDHSPLSPSRQTRHTIHPLTTHFSPLPFTTHPALTHHHPHLLLTHCTSSFDSKKRPITFTLTLHHIHNSLSSQHRATTVSITHIAYTLHT